MAEASSTAYAAVHARPDGDSTVARLAKTAADYGFDGIVVRNHGDDPAAYDPEAVSERSGIDVVTAVEVRAAEPSTAGGYIGSHRETETLVLVHGGDPDLNRFAVEQPAVDVLAHPMVGEGDLNHVLIQAADRNGVRIEVNLRRVLRREGGERVRALQDLRKLRELLADADAPYVVSADARSHLQLRSPRDMVALGETIGFRPEQIETGLAEWQALAERNRDRHSERFVEPGVRRVPDEPDAEGAETDETDRDEADAEE